jgi:hypothetical protein
VVISDDGDELGLRGAACVREEIAQIAIRQFIARAKSSELWPSGCNNRSAETT